ncbi:hypothetical protein [Streptomyces longwoodensis]|uniref:hypothetical protein n=1 Tax=Streptomyces longwoodensis TaxID=68231 RepID=UPI0037F5AEF7
MAGQDSYGQGIVVASLTDAPNAEVLARNIADGIAQRSVLRFASAAARAAALTGATAPVEGMVSWLQDVDQLQVYNGSSWAAQPTLIMDWTALSSLGSYAGGFTASTPPPRMRKISMLGTEVWEYEGAINIAALSPNTTTTGFTFTAAYRPVTGRTFAVASSSHYAARVTIASTGILTVSVPLEAGSSVGKFWLDGMRITNPTA